MTFPYEDKFATWLEFINEFLFLAICYCFELSTDLVE